MAKQRDYAAEYRRRVARGRAAGKTLAESVGKAGRDYAAEYEQRVEREVAAGRRKQPNRAAPRNRKAPTGQRLTGAVNYRWPAAADKAERGTVRKLRSDRRVFLYATVGFYFPDELDEYTGEPGIDLEELAADDPAEALRLLRAVGQVDDYQLFPNGGIRADTLRQQGDLENVILREVGGTRVRASSRPTINADNRKERSPRGASRGREGDPTPVIVSVTVQWT